MHGQVQGLQFVLSLLKYINKTHNKPYLFLLARAYYKRIKHYTVSNFWVKFDRLSGVSRVQLGLFNITAQG